MILLPEGLQTQCLEFPDLSGGGSQMKALLDHALSKCDFHPDPFYVDDFKANSLNQSILYLLKCRIIE